MSFFATCPSFVSCCPRERVQTAYIGSYYGITGIDDIVYGENGKQSEMRIEYCSKDRSMSGCHTIEGVVERKVGVQ